MPLPLGAPAEAAGAAAGRGRWLMVGAALRQAPHASGRLLGRRMHHHGGSSSPYGGHSMLVSLHNAAAAVEGGLQPPAVPSAGAQRPAASSSQPLLHPHSPVSDVLATACVAMGRSPGQRETRLVRRPAPWPGLVNLGAGQA